MFPNTKRPTFSHHIHNNMEVPLLKQAAIYGANGSGKSNFIKAISFLRDFVTRENFLQSLDLEDYIFQLAEEKSRTMSFEIEVFYGGQYYIYRAGISQAKIIEKLFVSGLGKVEDQLIFERDGDTLQSEYLQNPDSARQLLERRRTSSLMSLNRNYPVIICDDESNVYNWFAEQLDVISGNSQIPALISIMSQQPLMLEFTNKVFEKIGVGIKSIEIKSSKIKEPVFNDLFVKLARSIEAASLKQAIKQNTRQDQTKIGRVENKRNLREIRYEKDSKTVQEFIFDQLGQSGYHKEMNISAQSDGTVRLLTLIPAFYEAMSLGKTVMIDEIDNSIHPNLMYELIRFYANNKSNGQLIFTTHTTQLLNQQKLVRPDEIWLTEKSEGHTKMFSLNDFKLHNTLNIENGYLDGRYGAVPVVEDWDIE
jgi:AAA15 family ATPase/GTPase